MSYKRNPFLFPPSDHERAGMLALEKDALVDRIIDLVKENYRLENPTWNRLVTEFPEESEPVSTARKSAWSGFARNLIVCFLASGIALAATVLLVRYFPPKETKQTSHLQAVVPAHLELNGKDWKVLQTPEGEEYFSLSVSCDTRVIEVNTNKPNARGNLLQGVEVSADCGDKKFRTEDVYSTSLDAWSLAEILRQNPALAAYLGGL